MDRLQLLFSLITDGLSSVLAASFSSDPDRLQVECDLFAEHIDYVEDVCKLISHVAVREADRVRAKHSQVGNSYCLLKCTF